MKQRHLRNRFAEGVQTKVMMTMIILAVAVIIFLCVVRCRREKRGKEKRLHWNKPENTFNLSLLKPLHTDLMELEALKRHIDDAIMDHTTPKSTPIVPVKAMKICDDSKAIQGSNLSSHYELGTVVDLPQQINARTWKKSQNRRDSMVIELFKKNKTRDESHIGKSITR
eukprot:1009717_1